MEPAPERPIFDPLNLYNESSEEKQQGRVKPLESSNPTPVERAVTDPMNIYADKAATTNEVKMSPSLPFLTQPALLEGVPGNRGFDPFNFSPDEDALQWNRVAELKHARLAMLAVTGWIGSELFNGPIAKTVGSPILLDIRDRVPNVLNGGLDQTPLAFWAATLGVMFALETVSSFFLKEETTLGRVPGDWGLVKGENSFFQQESELFHGRLAMMAITAFAFTEWWTQTAIVHLFN